MRKNPIYDEYEYACRQLNGIRTRIERLDLSIERLEQLLQELHYQEKDKVYKNIQRLKQVRREL